MNSTSRMPSIFLGTWKLPAGRDTTRIINEAIDIGYRGIDCAYSYGNDFFAGKAVKNTSVARDRLFITNKLWKTFATDKESVLTGCKKSLKLMKLDYFDLYLIHWPIPTTDPDWEEKNAIVWSGMEMLVNAGLVKSIGTSNFLPHHLESVLKSGKIKPAVNQIEYHPGCNQKETVMYCANNCISIQGWSPLGSGKLLGNNYLNEIAKHRNKTPAQICLRWALQNGVTPVPRSSKIERLKENFDIFDFSLDDKEMDIISNKIPENNSGFTADGKQPE